MEMVFIGLGIFMNMVIISLWIFMEMVIISLWIFMNMRNMDGFTDIRLQVL